MLCTVCQEKPEPQASLPTPAKGNMTKKTEAGKSQNKEETHQTTGNKAGAKVDQGSVIIVMK